MIAPALKPALPSIADEISGRSIAFGNVTISSLGTPPTATHGQPRPLSKNIIALAVVPSVTVRPCKRSLFLQKAKKVPGGMFGNLAEEPGNSTIMISDSLEKAQQCV